MTYLVGDRIIEDRRALQYGVRERLADAEGEHVAGTWPADVDVEAMLAQDRERRGQEIPKLKPRSR